MAIDISSYLDARSNMFRKIVALDFLRHLSSRLSPDTKDKNFAKHIAGLKEAGVTAIVPRGSTVLLLNEQGVEVRNNSDIDIRTVGGSTPYERIKASDCLSAAFSDCAQELGLKFSNRGDPKAPTEETKGRFYFSLTARYSTADLGRILAAANQYKLFPKEKELLIEMIRSGAPQTATLDGAFSPNHPTHDYPVVDFKGRSLKEKGTSHTSMNATSFLGLGLAHPIQCIAGSVDSMNAADRQAAGDKQLTIVDAMDLLKYIRLQGYKDGVLPDKAVAEIREHLFVRDSAIKAEERRRTRRRGLDEYAKLDIQPLRYPPPTKDSIERDYRILKELYESCLIGREYSREEVSEIAKKAFDNASRLRAPLNKEKDKPTKKISVVSLDDARVAKMEAVTTTQISDKKSKKLVVLNVIPNLNSGGVVENMYKYIRGSQENVEHIIVTFDPHPSKHELSGKLDYYKKLSDLGVKIIPLHIKQFSDQEACEPHVKSTIQKYNIKADAVQGYELFAASLSGQFATQLNAPLIIRMGTAHPKDQLGTRAAALIPISQETVNKIASAVICNCERTREVCVSDYGYRADKLKVIPNGIDLTRFSRNESARLLVRQQLAIPPSAPVVGMVARNVEMKDPEGFLLGAAKVLKRRPETHFLLCGLGMTNDGLQDTIASVEQKTGVLFGKHLHLVGERSDIENYYNAMDVYAQTSVSDFFCNTTIEAKATGLPMIATDTASFSEYAKANGAILPIRDTLLEERLHHRNKSDPIKYDAKAAKSYDDRWSDEFATKALKLIDVVKNPKEKERIASEEIADAHTNYSLEKMVGGYVDLTRQVVAEPKSPSIRRS